MAAGEFEFIAERLRPLAAGSDAALGLADDAALLTPPPGQQLVLTKDAMVAGVHFLAGDPPDHIAQKLLRVNLSDLAAMGAKPLGYLLALARPADTTDQWLAAFTAGLAADQAEFGLELLGGDTVSTPGPLCLSLTALGTVPAGAALLRRGAHADDDLWVSGTLGDAAFGLKVLQGQLDVSPERRSFLIERYRRPRPRVALGLALRGIANAAIDVSDGLVADLGHILETSALGAELWADAMPRSTAARDLDGAREMALTGGDDYELLFTAPAGRRADLETISNRLGVALTRIGQLSVTPGLRIRDHAGRDLKVASPGWRHF